MKLRTERPRSACVLQPKVKPNYRRDSKFTSMIVTMIVFVAMVLSFIISGEFMILLIAMVFVLEIISSVLGMMRGDYELAVKAVNSVSVDEWAYNNGIAVMRLTDGTLMILDTKMKQVYLAQEYFSRDHVSLGPGAMKMGIGARIRIRATYHPLQANISIKDLPNIKKLEVIRGEIEAPSIRSEKGVMRGFGVILRAKLGKRCLNDMRPCIDPLLRILRERL
ncbi:MAG: hypothetical protein ACXQTB_02030 [Candidatus Nezhaarchaeales archaeon]